MNNVLVVAAHSDDEVLGCGGTIAKLTASGIKVSVMFMTNGVSARTIKNSSTASVARENHARKAASILGIDEVLQYSFPDNSMDSVPLLDVTKCIEQELSNLKPDTIFTHSLKDLNIDHQIVAQACITATRPQQGMPVKEIYGFEVNSSTEWSFSGPSFNPKYFVNISSFFQTKINALKVYKDEVRSAPHPRSAESIETLAKYRGFQAGYGYAEAFEIFRIIES